MRPHSTKIGLIETSRRAIQLIWQSPQTLRLTFILALTTVIAGLLPAAIAWVGKILVDIIVAATQAGDGVPDALFGWLAFELGLVIILAANSRLSATVRNLLRDQLGHRVNMMILDRALDFGLDQFEDADTYDRITQARQEASRRPVSLITRLFDGLQACLSLISYGAILWGFSPWASLALILAGLPSFFAEAKFAGDAFRLFRWRTPEVRQQRYLETILAREDHVKEVKLFGLGPRFLKRYEDIFFHLYGENKNLAIRRGLWGVGLGVLGSAAFYGAYAWIAYETALGHVTLGAMTMYLAIFRQGQGALSSLLGSLSGLYEDNLYLSSLYELLDEPSSVVSGKETGPGPNPADGIRFENVSFTYPGAERPALSQVSFHVPAGEKLAIVGENGSGKTTLVKLLARFYRPTEGRILFEGRDLQDWDEDEYRKQIGVIFQDYVRYQLKVGENIGAGDDDAFEDTERWREAAEKGLAAPFIDEMKLGYDTQLGRWFKDGRELSLGQWQKIALSRALMREDAKILVLDEPTASMDAGAELQIFERFHEYTQDRIAILISHRFSTVRMADLIIVIDGGHLIETGSHETLLAEGGRYATLFEMQAASYR